MLSRFLGKKIGMTQIFTESGKVVPVTVINVSKWFVTQIKVTEKDGYAALQLGLLKKKYYDQPFVQAWLKNKKQYFSHLREVLVDEQALSEFKLGQEISLDNIDFKEAGLVKVSGYSKGEGFQGVVKRWGFGGGPASHGSTFHRLPGSISNLCSQGEVVKGKKLPGHSGNRKVTIDKLEIVRLDKDGGYLFVKGAVPGRKDSLVTICKQG